jgi:hypothetical protein
MAEDWMTDLREFGAEIVSKACGEWRRSQTRRPTIAEIRKLCIEEQSLAEHLALPRPEMTDGEIDYLARQMAYKWAQSHGFTGIDEWALQPGADLAVTIAPGVRRYFRKAPFAAVRDAPAYRL